MKLTRKLLALVLAAMLVLAMSVTAFALDSGSGSITINNATSDVTYNIYKIFDTDSTGTGNITATEAQKSFYEKQNGNPFTFTKNASGSYNVSVTSDKSSADVITFLQSFYTETTGDDGSTTYTLDTNFDAVVDAGTAQTASSATVTFSNIPYGYYLVTSSLGATVTVDSTNPSVTVIDKNQSGPSWNTDKDGYGKTVLSVNDTDLTDYPDKISANYGDTIKFQLKFDATNYDGAAQILEYYVNDTLGTGMSYVLKNSALDVEVKVGDTTLASTAYTATLGTDNQSFKITIPWVTSKTTDNVSTVVSNYTSPTTITVTYSATVNTDAAIAGNGNGNTATMGYKTDKDTGDEPDNGWHTSSNETVTTYTYALGILKTDSKGNALSGAEFSVKLGDATIGAVKNTDGTYSYTSNNNADGYTTTFVSDDYGLIVIKGVAAGDYTVTETKAPAGYNLLNDAVTVTATMDSETTYTNTITTYYDSDGNVVSTKDDSVETKKTNTSVAVSGVTVVNYTGAELPSTGGVGTTIFYIVGAVLVIGAGVLLVTKKRMSVEG